MTRLLNWLYWRSRCFAAEKEIAARGAIIDRLTCQRDALKKHLRRAEEIADSLYMDLLHAEARAKAHERLLTHKIRSGSLGSCVMPELMRRSEL